jgi:NTE family protein
MKTALVLPGGGSKGAFEVGACKEIFKKFSPDLIIGTSVGALNGVVLANGKDIKNNLKKLDTIWQKASRKTFFPHNYKLFYKYHHAQSIYSHEGLLNQLKQNVTVKNFEELDIPLFINCTNMNTGKTKLFKKGEIIKPILASCSLPPFFKPVYINKIPYIDGGISNYLGISNLKYEQIIVVNVLQKQNLEMKNNLSEYTSRMSSIIMNQLIKDEVKLAQKTSKLIDISANFKYIHLSDFGHTKELIQLGEKTAKKVLKNY